MKKIDLGQTINILANVGVIAGIIFLGAELRQTQRSMQAQAYQARAFDAIAWDFEVAKDENLLRIYSEMTSDGFEPSSLTEADYQIAVLLAETLRIDVDNEHYQYRSGFLDQGFYNSTTVPMIRIFAPVWRALGPGESRAEFRQEVDRILADSIVSSSDE